ncbi:hypothetical protein ACU4GA_02375 [Methylobacterium oryzae CBMB20]
MRGSRPTGYIDRDVAAWLAASLSGRDGPSAVGARHRHGSRPRGAESSAESLVAFALEANRRARDTVQAPRMTFALAA